LNETKNRYKYIYVENKNKLSALPLLEWLLKTKDQQIIPTYIITDFSWAMLHAAASAIVQLSLKAVIMLQWRCLIGVENTEKPIIRLCVSHFIPLSAVE